MPMKPDNVWCLNRPHLRHHTDLLSFRAEPTNLSGSGKTIEGNGNDTRLSSNITFYNERIRSAGNRGDGRPCQ